MFVVSQSCLKGAPKLISHYWERLDKRCLLRYQLWLVLNMLRDDVLGVRVWLIYIVIWDRVGAHWLKLVINRLLAFRACVISSFSALFTWWGFLVVCGLWLSLGWSGLIWFLDFRFVCLLLASFLSDRLRCCFTSRGLLTIMFVWVAWVLCHVLLHR